ncbi:DMT family transporter [Actinoplanes missouriensis]|uniref:DMT family transporter n=1 Tax=Actinoplanes missouriensis TaxID=1866 RepID=UPI001E5A4711|nr:DMT family transporter [Actinoplanes missouriensis]
MFSKRFTLSNSATAGARLSLLQLSAAGILWGTAGVVVQVVAESTGLGAVAIGFYRLLSAAAVLLLLGLFTRDSTPATGARQLLAAFRGAPVVIVLAGAGLAAYQALYFVAVRLGGVSIATVVSLGIAPVLLSAWETARTRQRPGTGVLAASAAALLGLALIAGATVDTGAPAAGLGLLAAVGSGVVYAASTALSRHTTQGVQPLTLTTLSCTIGAITLLPIAAVEGLAFTPQAKPIALLGYAGAITTALAYALFYTGLRRTTGSVAVVVTLLEPLTAALLAVLLIDEPLGAATIAGGALLLGAVATLYVGAAQPTEPAAERAGEPAAGLAGEPAAGPVGSATEPAEIQPAETRA